MSDDDLRRSVKRSFSSRGIMLEQQSLTFLTEQLSLLNKELRQKTLDKLFEIIQKDNASGGFLKLDQLKSCISHTRKNECEIVFKLENFVEWRSSLDFTCQQEKNIGDKKWTVLANACMQSRFSLIRQAINGEILEEFNQTDALFLQRNVSVKILAMLSRESSSSKLTIEDFSGEVRVNLKSAVYNPALYFEGGTFVFEGFYDGSQFVVNKVRLPPIAAAPVPHKRKTAISSNERIIFLSDIRFDDSAVFSGLINLFEGFKSDPPHAFIFFGPFTTVETAYDYTDAQLSAFKQFANLLKKYAMKNLSYFNTEFILIPSIEDPPYYTVLPSPSLPPNIKEIFKEFKNVSFGSNPCRLIYKDCSFVLCKDDMIEKLCRASIHMPDDATSDSIPILFCNTIWSQRHISPLPLHFSPINPNFDCLFQLSTPDLIVLADKYKAFAHDLPSGIQVINPGSFLLSNLGFIVYYPGIRRAELSAIPTN